MRSAAVVETGLNTSQFYCTYRFTSLLYTLTLGGTKEEEEDDDDDDWQN